MWFSWAKKESAERRESTGRRKEDRRKAVNHNYLGEGYRCMNVRHTDRRKTEEDRRGEVERELNKKLYGYIDKGWL